MPVKSALCGAAVACVWSCLAIAEVHHVPNEFTSIQEALDVTSSGDTVLVESGTYIEVLVAPATKFYFIGAGAHPVINVSSLDVDDSTAALTLPPQARVSIERIALKNDSRYGIRSRADSVWMSDCMVDSTEVGFRHAIDSIDAYVEMTDCRYRFCRLRCVLIQAGNFLRASDCLFVGREGETISLVAATISHIDHCMFLPLAPRGMLVAILGPHTIEHCTFGPGSTADHGDAIMLGDRSVVFANNRMTNIQYGSHVVYLTSYSSDSVEIRDNTFENCVALEGEVMGNGVLCLNTGGAVEHGALISGNEFVGCSGNNYVDDISLIPYDRVHVTAIAL